jgi:sugar/nucleoside kinase (ribokinase family)
MHPEFLDHVPQLLPGLTAFMPSEQEALSLFRGKTDDLWEIAEALGAYSCELVVITLGEGGQRLYISATGEKFEIPAYPAHPVDITGAGDAFAGGFLAGFQKTYDPLKAVMYGNVSASITVEGSGAFFLRDTLPGLHRARLETLSGLVTRV